MKPPDLGSLERLGIHCAICSDILEDPLMVRACQHTFCRDCIGRALREIGPDRCPTCRGSLQSANDLTRPPRALTNLLDQLRIKCSHGATCQSKPMDLSVAREHEKNCNTKTHPRKLLVCQKGCKERKSSNEFSVCDDCFKDLCHANDYLKRQLQAERKDLQFYKEKGFQFAIAFAVTLLLERDRTLCEVTSLKTLSTVGVALKVD